MNGRKLVVMNSAIFDIVHAANVRKFSIRERKQWHLNGVDLHFIGFADEFGF